MLIPILLLLGVLLTLASVILHINALHHSGYWARRGIPGPPSQPYLGNIHQFSSANTVRVLQLREWTRQYGRVYGVQQGWTNIMVCSDVHALNEMFQRKFEYFHGRKNSPLLGNVDTNHMVGMFNSRGQRWKRLRAIATPAFSVNNLKRILPILEDSSRAMMHFMDEAHHRGQPFNIHPHFHELTMDVISRVAMGQPDSRQFRTEYTQMAKRVFARFGNNTLDYIGWIFPRCWWFIRAFAIGTAMLRREPFMMFHVRIDAEVKRRKREKEEREEEERMAAGREMANGNEEDSLEEEKEAHKRRRPVDFIDLFLEAESGGNGGGGNNEPGAGEWAAGKKEGERAVNGGGAGGTFNRAKTKVERRMSVQEITSQCILFLLAGFDTTANTLAITCWYLAWHPAVQGTLQREIDTICGQHRRGQDEGEEEGDEEFTISYEQLAQMRYSDAVMREVLRLQPIAANVIDRQCAQTTTLGEWHVEAGTIVQPDLFTIHRDTALWGPDADEFRPERWFDESANQRAAAALGWLPFGAGPRICLGMRFAQIEQKLALAHLLSRYSIRRCPETEPELHIVGEGVFNPSSVTVRLEARQ